MWYPEQCWGITALSVYVKTDSTDSLFENLCTVSQPLLQDYKCLLSIYQVLHKRIKFTYTFLLKIAKKIWLSLETAGENHVARLDVA